MFLATGQFVSETERVMLLFAVFGVRVIFEPAVRVSVSVFSWAVTVVEPIATLLKAFWFISALLGAWDGCE